MLTLPLYRATDDLRAIIDEWVQVSQSSNGGIKQSICYMAITLYFIVYGFTDIGLLLLPGIVSFLKLQYDFSHSWSIMSYLWISLLVIFWFALLSLQRLLGKKAFSLSRSVNYIRRVEYGLELMREQQVKMTLSDAWFQLHTATRVSRMDWDKLSHWYELPSAFLLFDHDFLIAVIPKRGAEVESLVKSALLKYVGPAKTCRRKKVISTGLLSVWDRVPPEISCSENAGFLVEQLKMVFNNSARTQGMLIFVSLVLSSLLASFRVNESLMGGVLIGYSAILLMQPVLSRHRSLTLVAFLLVNIVGVFCWQSVNISFVAFTLLMLMLIFILARHDALIGRVFTSSISNRRLSFGFNQVGFYTSCDGFVTEFIAWGSVQRVSSVYCSGWGSDKQKGCYVTLHANIRFFVWLPYPEKKVRRLVKQAKQA